MYIYVYILYIYIPKATSAPPRAGTTGNLIQLTCKLIKLKTCLVLTFTALIFFIFSSFSIEKKPNKSKPHLSGHHSGLEEKTPPDQSKGAEGRPEEEDRKKKQQGRKQVRKTLAAESSWRHGDHRDVQQEVQLLRQDVQGREVDEQAARVLLLCRGNVLSALTLTSMVIIKVPERENFILKKIGCDSAEIPRVVCEL